MLEAKGRFNQLSKGLREDLEKRASAAGKIVQYRFDIARKNPDGERRTGGEYLYPLIYTLTPVTFEIVDPYDKQLKRIGMAIDLIETGGSDDHFARVVLKEGHQGVFRLDMENPADRDMFAYLELHPKMDNGMFQEKGGVSLIKRIDETKQATESFKKRNLRVDAMFVAVNMTIQETKDFASAMGWDESEDPIILRDRITELADGDPEFFKSFIDNKNIEYRALIKRAIDKEVITYQPVESRFVWVSNGQTIAVLERAEGGQVLDRMTDWITTSKNGMEVFAKIKGLVNQRSKV